MLFHAVVRFSKTSLYLLFADTEDRNERKTIIKENLLECKG